VLEQLLPTSKRIADFALSFRLTRSDREAGVEAADLHGDWMVQGGGYLLEFARDSSYVVVDRFGEFVDQGRWRTRGEELTMTSAPSAGDCTEGDELVLGDIEYFGYRPVVLRGTVRQNDCGGAWASTAWWMLPDAAN
jgi:hypothetical protein